MFIDEAGLFWISNLWVAVGLISITVGVVLFSHGWVVTGRVPRPRRMAVRMPRSQRLAAIEASRAQARHLVIVPTTRRRGDAAERRVSRDNRRLVA